MRVAQVAKGVCEDEVHRSSKKSKKIEQEVDAEVARVRAIIGAAKTKPNIFDKWNNKILSNSCKIGKNQTKNNLSNYEKSRVSKISNSRRVYGKNRG